MLFAALGVIAAVLVGWAAWDLLVASRSPLAPRPAEQLAKIEEFMSEAEARRPELEAEMQQIIDELAIPEGWELQLQEQRGSVSCFMSECLELTWYYTGDLPQAEACAWAEIQIAVRTPRAKDTSVQPGGRRCSMTLFGLDDRFLLEIDAGADIEPGEINSPPLEGSFSNVLRVQLRFTPGEEYGPDFPDRAIRSRQTNQCRGVRHGSPGSFELPSDGLTASSPLGIDALGTGTDGEPRVLTSYLGTAEQLPCWSPPE